MKAIIQTESLYPMLKIGDEFTTISTVDNNCSQPLSFPHSVIKNLKVWLTMLFILSNAP